MMSLSQKIAVVTGANRGIGFEVCRQLAKQNFQVILTSHDESKGQAATYQLNKEGVEVLYHSLDVTQPESSEQLASFLGEKFGRLDVRVNNAGAWLDNLDSSDGSVLKTKIATLSKTIEVNLYRPLMLCQYLIPLMKKQELWTSGEYFFWGGAISRYAQRLSKLPDVKNCIKCINANFGG